MKIRSLQLAAVYAAVLFVSSFVFAQIPRTISYQGILADGSGNLVPDGNHTLTLRIYESASGGSAIFTETHTVPVVRGVFNSIIGSSTPIPPSVGFDKAYFLGVTVDGGAELSPRTAMTAAPYALRAAMADAVSATATGIVRSVNGQEGAISFTGGGGTTITNVGGAFTISSTGGGGTGIQGVQNGDASITIANPSGPTATISVSNLGITNDKLQNASVTVSKINSLGGTAGQVMTADGAGNASWVSLPPSSGLTLPYSNSLANASSLFSLTNSGAASAGSFINSNATPTQSALYGESNATSPTLTVAGVEGKSVNGFGVIGRGGVGSSAIFGTVITTPTGGSYFASTGVSGFSDVSNGVGGVTYHSNPASSGVRGSATGNGNGVHGTSSTGRAGIFEILNNANTSNALEGKTNGSGIAIYGQSSISSGASATGIHGEASSTSHGTGATGGVTGVLGKIVPTGPGGYSAGVRGINSGTGGTGIGVIGHQAGSGWGVYGETPSGFGVYGLTTNSSASSVGVRGETFSTAGIAVEAKYSGTGVGTAIEVDNGGIKVAGTNKASFIHTATVANKLSANGTDIDNAMCNGDPNALLQVTQKLNPSGIVYNNAPIGVYYNSVRSKWEIFNENNATIPTNAQFIVLVIKQ